MKDALEGPAPPRRSFRDEANAARIGRSRFIGHAVGMILILGLILFGVQALAARLLLQSAPSQPALDAMVNHTAAVIVSLLLLCALLDLAVRRRHDRGGAAASTACLSWCCSKRSGCWSCSDLRRGSPRWSRRRLVGSVGSI